MGHLSQKAGTPSRRRSDCAHRKTDRGIAGGNGVGVIKGHGQFQGIGKGLDILHSGGISGLNSGWVDGNGNHGRQKTDDGDGDQELDQIKGAFMIVPELFGF